MSVFLPIGIDASENASSGDIAPAAINAGNAILFPAHGKT
jgi:hypothetical protein